MPALASHDTVCVFFSFVFVINLFLLFQVRFEVNVLKTTANSVLSLTVRHNFSIINCKFCLLSSLSIESEVTTSKLSVLNRDKFCRCSLA